MTKKAKTKRRGHLHRYQRVDIGVKKPYMVHRCVKHCTHYVPLLQKDTEPFYQNSTKHPIIGKRAECWRCGEEFLIGFLQAKMAKPHCNNCVKRKSGLTDTALDELLNKSEDFNLDDFMGKFR